MRKTTAALGVVVALAVMVLSSGTATGAIDNVTGAIEFLSPAPPSVMPGALMSDTAMRAFDERQHFTLAAPLSVDITQPGTYDENHPLTPGTIPAGTLVNSQFIHVDIASLGPIQLEGTIHTTTDILGVNVLMKQLNESDFLGAPGTAYPTGVNGRGLEFNDNQQDLVIEQVDRRTLFVHSDIRRRIADQIRVITKGNTPPSVSSGGAASGAEGSAIALAGSATDPDGPVTSTWTYVAGGGVDPGATCAFGDASSPSTSITCTDNGHYTATLTADDGSGAVMDTASVDVANAKPSVSIASPSGGSSYGSSPVSLSAPFTDAGQNDSHTCSIDWGDGSPASAGTVTESNGSGTCTGSHTYSTGGAHTIAATVTDDNAGSDSASVTVVNAAPSVAAGPNGSGVEGSAIGLSGSVSDPDGPAGTTSWSFAPGMGVDAGATCSFADASSPATTVTCTDDGSYTVTLTSSDGLNPAVSNSATVTVSNANPSVSVTAPAGGSAYGSDPVAASASFSDAGRNDSHTCSITWGDGSPASTGTVTESNGSGTCAGSHTYSSGGSHAITVTVTDDDAGAGSDSVSVVNSAPSVSAGPNASGAEGSAINLNGAVSDADGPAGTTGWTYTAGPGVDAGATCAFGSASSPATTITCTDDGTYTVRLTSSDGLNPAVSSTATVTVSNAAPVVTITSPAVGASYVLTTPVAVSAAFTDAGKNDSHTCKVNWGDSTPLQTRTVTESNGVGTCTAMHTYTTGGAHTITVTVTDDDTAAGSDTRALAAATAMSLKQAVLNQALALIPTANKLDQVRLALVAIGVAFSLQPTLWVDGNHIKENGGSCVFTGEEGAIFVLQDLLAHGSVPAATVQGMINNLLAADQILAQTAINDAVAAHGNATKISDAKKEMTYAATSIAHNDPNGAIDHYELAWSKAMAAF